MITSQFVHFLCRFAFLPSSSLRLPVSFKLASNYRKRWKYIHNAKLLKICRSVLLPHQLWMIYSASVRLLQHLWMFLHLPLWMVEFQFFFFSYTSKTWISSTFEHTLVSDNIQSSSNNSNPDSLNSWIFRSRLILPNISFCKCWKMLVNSNFEIRIQ